MSAVLRVAKNLDIDAIREVHLQAFSGDEKQQVAILATHLLSEKTSPETFALVAEIDGTVVGHIAFSPVTINSKKNWQGYILAPLGVKPPYQKRRIGSQLIENGIARLSKQKINALFVYGDPEYYGKFGFKAETATHYLPPYELLYPFGWQALVLNQEDYSLEHAVKLTCVASLQDPALW